MASNLCLRLPYMHPEMGGKELASFHFFWPLKSPFPEDIPYWRSDCLPLAKGAIDSFFEMARGADSRELERQCLLLSTQPGPSFRYSEMREMEDLASFRRYGEIPGHGNEGRQNLEKSHLFLLWLWLLEENIHAIKGMEESCANLDARLLDILLEDTEEWYSPQKSTRMPDLSPLPDWRLAAGHMIPFIPPEIPLLAEGEMRICLLETGRFAPYDETVASKWQGPEKLLAMRASFEELGGNAPVPGEVLRQQRLWLILEEE